VAVLGTKWMVEYLYVVKRYERETDSIKRNLYFGSYCYTSNDIHTEIDTFPFNSEIW